MQYLDAMGIDTYIPRYLFSNTRKPSLCELPVVHASSATSTENETHSREVETAIDETGNVGRTREAYAESSDTHFTPVIDPQPSDDSVSVGLNQPVENAQVVDHKTRPIEERSKTESSEKARSLADVIANAGIQRESLSFALNLWRISPYLMAIDSCQKKQALPTHRLLENIIHQLSLSPSTRDLFLGREFGQVGNKVVTPSLAKNDRVSWPMGGLNPVFTDIESEWASAREMVGAFLESRLIPSPVRYLFLFGEEAFTALCSDARSFEETLFETISIDAFAAQAVVLPSLAHVLYHPLEKNRVWEALSKTSPN